MKQTSITLIACAVALMLMIGCKQTQNTVSLILDTDIGNDIDDVECLDIVSKYVDEGKAELLALMLSKPGLDVAEAADIYTTWYGLEEVPIGVVLDTVNVRGAKYIDAVQMIAINIEHMCGKRIHEK